MQRMTGLGRHARAPGRQQHSAAAPGGWLKARVAAPRTSIAARASSSSSRSPWGAPPPPITPEDVIKRAGQLQELLQETANIVASTGPRGFARAAQGAQALASLAAEVLPTIAPGAPGGGGAAAARQFPPEVLLRKLFERLGATYIKLGQFVASSPSLFPEAYVLEFQKLLDAAPPLPYDAVRAVVEAELGCPVGDVFSYVDPAPLASASVAQVHAATLRGSGQRVVLKVLKPGTEDVLSTDLNFIYLVSRYLELLYPELSRLSLAPILADVRASMLEEVDFTREAANLAAFASFLDGSGLRAAATCPYVYRQFSGRRLLVMERLVGVPLTDLDAVRSITDAPPERVLIGALNTWFASVLAAESFHADVHAGNLLALPDGRVGFIDFGIVGRISPATWRGTEALIAAAATRDYDTMARALATIGATSDDVDYAAFARDLESFFASLDKVNAGGVVLTESGGGPGSVGVGDGMTATLGADADAINRLLLDVVRLGEAHGIRFPREFGLFVKQLLYFDTYVRALAPGLSVFDDARVDWRGAATTGAAVGGRGGGNAGGGGGGGYRLA